MQTQPVGIAGGLTGGEFPLAPTRAPAGGDASFRDLITGMLNDANNQQADVGKSIEQLVTGESDSVHDVVLSVAKADLAFRLVMEVRNRLISSYQEIMRMQV